MEPETKVLDLIDRLGRPMSRDDWRDFLRGIIDECEMRIVASNEDDEREKEGR